MKTVEIKRLKDGMYSDPKTGWSAYPFQYSAGEGRFDVRGVHVVAIYPGQLRGNHYHKETEELLFIFSGKGMFYWEEEGGLMQHPVSGTPTSANPGTPMARMPARTPPTSAAANETIGRPPYVSIARDTAARGRPMASTLTNSRAKRSTFIRSTISSTRR